MNYPLTSSDIDVWLTFVAIMVLMTAEVASHFGPARGLLVDKSRLRTLAFTTAILLFVVLVARVLQFLNG